VLVPMGKVRRAAQERVSLIRFDAAGQLLGVMGRWQDPGDLQGTHIQPGAERQETKHVWE